MEEADEHFRLQRVTRLKVLLGDGLDTLILAENRLTNPLKWEDNPNESTAKMYTLKLPFIADMMRELFGNDIASTSWSTEQIDEALTHLASRQLQ